MWLWLAMASSLFVSIQRQPAGSALIFLNPVVPVDPYQGWNGLTAFNFNAERAEVPSGLAARAQR
jgi:hypothetical protein